MHVGAKAPEIRRGLARRGTPGAAAGLTAEQAAERAAVDEAAETNGVPRRAFVLAAGLGVGAVTLTTVGQTLLAAGAGVGARARGIPGVGPQGAAGAADRERGRHHRRRPGLPAGGRGPAPAELTLADLQRVPAAHRAAADHLRGGLERRRHLDRRPAGRPARGGRAARDTEVRRRVAADRRALPDVDRGARRTPAARARCWPLRLNGSPLAPDHGYPVRLIAPNRPGVMQTKWVTRVTPA